MRHVSRENFLLIFSCLQSICSLKSESLLCIFCAFNTVALDVFVFYIHNKILFCTQIKMLIPNIVSATESQNQSG